MDRTRLNWMVSLLTAVFVFGCQEPNKPGVKDAWNHNSMPAKLAVAQNQLEQGLPDKAAQTVTECLKAEPDNPRVHIMAGQVRLALNQTEPARQSFAKAVELDPAAADGWFGLGIIVQGAGDNAGALEHYRKAMDLSPQRTDYIIAAAQTLSLLGQPDEGLSLLGRQLGRTGGDVDMLRAAAELSRKAGRLSQAEDYYNRAVIADPSDKGVMISVAEFYCSQDKWAQAADIFEKLLSQSAGAATQEYLRRAAECSLNAERFDKALGLYDRLSVQCRQDGDVWLGMAKSALGAGDAVRAKYSVQKALTIRPGWNQAVAVLGCAQYLTGQYAEAADAFNSLEADTDLGGFALLMKGRSLQKMGKTSLADETFAIAQKTHPDSRLMRLVCGKKENDLPEQK